MGEPRSTVFPVSKALELIGPGHHLSLFASSEQEESAVLALFLRLGVERGERCLYVAQLKRLAGLRRVIGPEQFDLERAVASGALKMAAHPNKPDRLARLMREAAEEARGSHSGLRVAIQMQHDDPGPERLIAGERALARAQAEVPFLLLCLYDRRRFAPESLLRVLYSHPFVIYGGMVCQNFQHRPAEALLRADRELEWVLKNICDRERFVGELRRAAGAPAESVAFPSPSGGCRDCLHRMAALEEIRQQIESMEAVGRLGSQLAAEFNNRLTVIMGYAELLAGAGEASEAFRKYAGHILAAARQAAVFTERILTFSRRQRPRLVRTDLNAALETMLPALREAAGSHLQVRLTPAPGLWPVTADAGLIEQALRDVVAVLRNVLLPGNAITLETANEEFGAKQAEVPPGRYVTLRVTDDGPGLDESTRARLLEPVFTFTETAAVPGLWAADAILKAHSGGILVRGPAGGPTTLLLYLPAAEADVQVGPAGRVE